MASSRVELDDGRVITKCDSCQSMHAERNPPTEPPCDSCRVDLMEENEGTAHIYLITQNQVIAGMDRVIDINHLAIYGALDLYGVKDRKRCFEKIIRAFAELNRKEN